MIIVRFADDFVAGSEYRDDAEAFWAALRERFAKFSLELHPDKTRLIEFGRYAVPRRKARGDGKPETFSFLGFTHICATRKGRFWNRRITDKKRLAAKLAQLRAELLRRRHLPVPDQGRWLASVITGHMNYYGVPGNGKAIRTFRDQATRHWHAALRRRSQKTRLTWERMRRLVKTLDTPAQDHASLPGTALRRQVLTVGAQCGNSARWDLRGGPPARAVPTATPCGGCGFRRGSGR